MPQIILNDKSNKLGEDLKGMVRSFSSDVAKMIWPLVPRRLFLNRIDRVCFALTRKCNAACTFCAYQFLENRFKRAMPNEVFDTVIEELKRNSISEVMLSPDLGEPLLAPNLIDKLKAIKKTGVETIELTTNGILLNMVGIDDILEYTDIINISFAGFDEEMCKRVYRISKYQQIKSNVLDLLVKNSERKKPKFIRIWLRGDIEVAEQLSFPEIDIVRKHADELAVMTEVDSWNGKITQEMLTGTMKLQAEVPITTKRPCLILENITIHPDGNIHACSCRNINNDMDLYLGNIKEISLRKAYDNIGTIYNKWENGYIPLICQSCYMYNDPANSILGAVKRVVNAR